MDFFGGWATPSGFLGRVDAHCRKSVRLGLGHMEETPDAGAKRQMLSIRSSSRPGRAALLRRATPGSRSQGHAPYEAVNSLKGDVIVGGKVGERNRISEIKEWGAELRALTSGSEGIAAVAGGWPDW